MHFNLCAADKAPFLLELSFSVPNGSSDPPFPECANVPKHVQVRCRISYGDSDFGDTYSAFLSLSEVNVTKKYELSK